MTEQRMQILAGIAMVVALATGALGSIARAGDGDPWFELPAFPGAVHAGSVNLHSAGVNVDHSSRDADVLRVPASIDAVTGFYAATPERWALVRQVVLPDGQYVLYLTQGEQLAIVRVMSAPVFQESSLASDLDMNDETDGAFVTIGLIKCGDSGGIETCLAEVAGR